MTNGATKLTVFKPFFVSASLPFSIKQNEIITLTFQVYNFMDNDVVAEVTFYNENAEFEFVEVNDNQDPDYFDDQERKKTITVKAQSGSNVSFMIYPTKVGSINIKVTATTDYAGDGLEKLLIVEPEGITLYMNKAVFIDLTKTTSFSTSLTIQVPSIAVEDSTLIEAAVIGDILGPAIYYYESQG